MYRIMVVKSKKDKFESLYQYLTTTVDGKTSPIEFDTPEALDTQVEKMLNEGGFSKSDFIVVQVIDYTIDANGYTGIADNAETQEPTTE